MKPRVILLIGAALLLCLIFVIVKLFFGHDGDYIPPAKPTTTAGGPVPEAALKKPHLQTRHHFPDGHVGPAMVAPDGSVVSVPN